MWAGPAASKSGVVEVKPGQQGVIASEAKQSPAGVRNSRGYCFVAALLAMPGGLNCPHAAAKRDQEQTIDIPGFMVPKQAESRAEQAHRCFAVLIGPSARAGHQRYIGCKF